MSRKRHRAQPGPDREQFLGQLVQEYNSTKDLEAKQQVLANLANFAYDSINHDWLWQVYAVDVFLNAIEQPDPLLKEFGMGGLTNICRDPQHSHYILSKPEHIEKIAAVVVSTSERPCTTDAVINAMVALMFLVNESSRPVIVTPALKDGLLRLQDPKTDKRIITVATLFLADYFQT